jgi:hypothetical protein
VFFKGQYGNAIQTVTKVDTTKIYFENGGTPDFFLFNQLNPTTGTSRPLSAVKQVGSTLSWPTLCPPSPPAAAPGGTLMTATSNFCSPVTLFKATMITYYVDNAGSNATTPRLTRQLNHACGTCPARFNPQALAGVVEDLDLTYDLYDGSLNPTEVPSLPWTTGTPAVTYTDSMIRKVNIHVGVRSETISKPTQDYVRNHISTSVNVRSLTAVDRYISQSQ